MVPFFEVCDVQASGIALVDDCGIDVSVAENKLALCECWFEECFYVLGSIC